MTLAPTLVLWNPDAGSSEDAAAVRDHLSMRPNTTVVDTKSMHDTQHAINLGVASGAKTIIAAGGDGTVNAVASAILRSGRDDLTLGIVPIGTGNDLARSLGIPLDDPSALIALLDSGDQCRIDTVRCQSAAGLSYFVNTATGGISSEVTKATSKDIKRALGSLSYFYSALKTLFAHKEAYDVYLELNGEAVPVMKVYNLILANGRTTAGGFAVAPHADLTDGMLDIIVIHQTSGFELAGVSARLASGHITEAEAVSHFRAHTININSVPSITFSTDGELVHQTPVLLQVMPGALSVISGYKLKALPAAPASPDRPAPLYKAGPAVPLV